MSKNDGGPAFPCNDATQIIIGMSLRDWYAGRAPTQALSWFKHRSRPKPERPEKRIDIYTTPETASLHATIQSRVDNWRKDPCYDLSDPDPTECCTSDELAAMAVYEVAWKKNWKDFDAWREQDLEDRYFQWRWHYADAMLKEREK